MCPAFLDIRHRVLGARDNRDAAVKGAVPIRVVQALYFHPLARNGGRNESTTPQVEAHVVCEHTFRGEKDEVAGL